MSGALTRESHIGYASVLPPPSNITMVSRKPHLTQVGRAAMYRNTLPDGWAERQAVLVKGYRVEGVLDAVRQIRVVEAELLSRRVNAQLG